MTVSAMEILTVSTHIAVSRNVLAIMTSGNLIGALLRAVFAAHLQCSEVLSFRWLPTDLLGICVCLLLSLLFNLLNAGHP